jgi:peptidoglycan/LPS O-acetylase OafA/YrhL
VELNAVEKKNNSVISDSLPTSKEFRGDIEGLRAVAVMLVVMAHVGLGLPAGFIGVDIFFVISGFLITKQLVHLVAKEHPIREFYKRRIVRILPASLITILMITLCCIYIFPEFMLLPSIMDGLASTFSVINYRLAYLDTDYFSAGKAVSPFQHYWSLAVEEQFYFVWPLIVFAIYKICKTEAKFKKGLIITLLVILCSSFLVSYYLSYTSISYAYFSVQARAWQLGLGCFLAVTSDFFMSFKRSTLELCAWLGLSLLIIGLIVITPESRYPGWVAIFPTFAAFLLILAGERHNTLVSKALAHPTAQFIGQISYSLYLVHWPIIQLAVFLIGDLSLFAKWLVVAISIFCAFLLHYLVENPIRYNKGLKSNYQKIFRLTEFALVSMSLFFFTNIYKQMFIPPPIAAKPVKNLEQIQIAIDKGIKATTASKEALDASNLEVRFPFFMLADDGNFNGCISLQSETSSTPSNRCTLGDVNSDKTIVLIGDSHAHQWIEALDRVAFRAGYKLVTMTKVGCPMEKGKVINHIGNTEYTECYAWQKNVMKQLREMHPDIIISVELTYHEEDPAAAKEYMQALLKITPHVVRFIDTPIPYKDMPYCMAQNKNNLQLCSFPPADKFNHEEGDKINAELKKLPIKMVDITKWFCNDQICPAVINDIPVYRDGSHISRRYEVYLSQLLEEALDLQGKTAPAP